MEHVWINSLYMIEETQCGSMEKDIAGTKFPLGSY